MLKKKKTMVAVLTVLVKASPRASACSRGKWSKKGELQRWFSG